VHLLGFWVVSTAVRMRGENSGGIHGGIGKETRTRCRWSARLTRGAMPMCYGFLWSSVCIAIAHRPLRRGAADGPSAISISKAASVARGKLSYHDYAVPVDPSRVQQIDRSITSHRRSRMLAEPTEATVQEGRSLPARTSGRGICGQARCAIPRPSA